VIRFRTVSGSWTGRYYHGSGVLCRGRREDSGGLPQEGRREVPCGYGENQDRFAELQPGGEPVSGERAALLSVRAVQATVWATKPSSKRRRLRSATAAGDIIFFDWDGDGGANHVGIVESCDGKCVYTIEGNTTDSCARRTYRVGAACIYGYGIPRY